MDVDLPYHALAPGLAIALLVGLLIGVERGWQLRREAAGSRVAGIRTFALIGISGGGIGLLASHGQPLLAAVLAAGVVALLVIYYARVPEASGSLSVTSGIAALLTLALGVAATSGFAVPALVMAAVATALLSMRQPLHRWLLGLSEADVKAMVRFVIIAAAILPLLPDRNFGPYGAWNPQQLWLVVVVVCGFSFAGYFANRRFGATRGTLVTAAIGGLYSSTAVSVALSQRLREQGPGNPAAEPRLLAAGIAIASATMFARVLVLTGLLAPFALPRLALVIGPAGIVAIGFVLWLLRGLPASDHAASPAVQTTNPFELLPAFGFALLVAVLALLVRWAEARFGDAGIATLLAITGAMDVDAAIVTMHGLAPGTVRPDLAGMILALPILLNTLLKAGIVLVNAGARRGWLAALPLLASAVFIIAALVLAWLMVPA